MKKIYQKPTIMVVPVNIKSHILAGSNPDGDGWGAYIPGMDEDMPLKA